MIAALGLLVGIVAGLVFAPDVPARAWSPTCPIAVVAALDAVFGGLRAYLDGIFDDKVFVVSFVSNVVIAAAIVFLGDQLGVGAPAVDRRRRRARHPDLLQRRRDPQARVPCLSHATDLPARTAGPRRAADRLPRCASPAPSRGRPSSRVLLAVLGLRLRRAGARHRGRRHLRRAARERPDRRARRPDRHHRARPPRGRPARDAPRRAPRRAPGARRRPSTRPSSGCGPSTSSPGSCRSPVRACGSPSPSRRAGSASARCSTPSRSCAPPAPRRWSSTTRSGSGADSSFEDAVGGIELDGQLLEPPYVLDVIGDPHILRTALTFSTGPIEPLERSTARR